MSAQFLSDEQARRYGRFAAEPSREQLDRYFLLDDADQEFVASKKARHNRFGLAVQLGTLRFLGTFLTDPLDVPLTVLAQTAHQLGFEPNSAGTERYRAGETRWDHQASIRRRYGYKEFSNSTEQFGLLRYLYARARVGAEPPGVLFDLATARLVERKVQLPGVSVLARLVTRILNATEARLWRVLAVAPNPVQRLALEALVAVPEGARASPLEVLRVGPRAISAPALVGALHRVEGIRAVGVGSLDLSFLPTNRVEVLARYGLKAKAQQLAQMRPDRRIATLVVALQRLEVDALEDALDLLDQLIAKINATVEREGAREQANNLPSLSLAALTLTRAVDELLDDGHPDLAALRQAVFDLSSREALAIASEVVKVLTRPPEDTRAEDLMRRYSQVRQFLPRLLGTVTFSATTAGGATLEAWRALSKLEGRKRVDADEVPLAVVTGPWRRLVVKSGDLNRPAYTLCVLEALRDALRRRDVYVANGRRFGDPQAKLLSGPAWEAQKSGVCRSLGLDPESGSTLAAVARELDETYRGVAARLATNAALQVGPKAGKKGNRPTLAALEPLEEPASLLQLREEVSKRLPLVDLPELLLEVDAWTGFTSRFTHLSETGARLEGKATSVVAVLVAEACNIGFAPVARSSVSDLARGRLSYVDQNYVRAETIAAANAALVDHQTTVPLARAWGGGQLASVDGLRFRVPVKTISAGPNPKYFGVGRGVTYLNFVSDQATGFHAIVVPGTLRDSLLVLDGLLEQNTSLRPTQLTSDTHGYSDVVFGLFRLLGYQFSPRLADLGDRTFWRIDQAADYGELNGLARHRINLGLIEKHWADILRVAGSLLTRAVKASDILRVLQGNGKPTALGRAIAEFGRIAKTRHLLNYLDDEAYRRNIGAQLNLHEGRHALARVVFHGRKGELRQRYREGMEDQLGALGLVVNAVVLWNTVYSDLALGQLRATGYPVREEDVERLSPLGHAHVNMLGRYQFALDEGVAGGRRRALRDPSALND